MNRAKFIDPERAKLSSIDSSIEKYSILNESKHEFLRDLSNNNNNQLIRIGDLLDLSKQSPSKFKRFKIEANKTRLLLGLCKEHGVKFSSLMTVLVSLALKMLYKKHNEEKKLENLVYYTAISLRQFNFDREIKGKKKLPNDSLGYYVGGTLCLIQIEDDISINEEDGWKSKFWTLCTNENDQLRKQVNSDCMFANLQQLTDPEKQLHLLFGMSNLGAMKQSLNGDDALITIESNFICANINEKLKNRYFFNSVSTVNDCVYWLLSYNSFFIDHFLLDQVIEFILLIIDKLV
jgi:hypothetical protein